MLHPHLHHQMHVFLKLSQIANAKWCATISFRDMYECRSTLVTDGQGRLGMMASFPSVYMDRIIAEDVGIQKEGNG